MSAKTARASLLGQGDVGKALLPDSYEPPAGPLYCQPEGSPDLAQATSATGVVGAFFASAKPQASIVEDVYLFKNSAAAAAALIAMQSGMACVTGHLYNAVGSATLVSVGPAVDYSHKLSSTASAAYGWTLRIGDQGGIRFGMTVRTTLIVVTYLLSTSALTKNGTAPNFPGAVAVASAALDHASSF
ncbi:MAG TPA: hypothetical protein VKQ07_09930 [Jatrophihabitantaceae bacterium]|nr:hypothetical protein [Jatrophihabitantaceae bacterium]